MTYTLKELRARKNISQAKAAKALGITTQTYNAWEKDFGRISIRKGAAIADFYGVKLDDIFFNKELENNSCKKKLYL